MCSTLPDLVLDSQQYQPCSGMALLPKLEYLTRTDLGCKVSLILYKYHQVLLGLAHVAVQK